MGGGSFYGAGWLPHEHPRAFPPWEVFHRRNVKLSDILPYPGNARHNEKAIPAVAESIREFGLRGQIVLESRENPVIVTGHTRVAAMKLLGWDEVPDDKIGNVIFRKPLNRGAF